MAPLCHLAYSKIRSWEKSPNVRADSQESHSYAEWLFLFGCDDVDERYEIHMFWYVVLIIVGLTINIQWGIWQYLKYKREEIREKYRNNEQE